jgi:hypothetical protein
VSRARVLLRAALVVLLAASAARLAALALRFGRESVQADFSAFYTAGRAARAGLSPYWNAPEREPPLWDGVSEFQTSRFLYPPLAASAFAPLTWMSYAVAKHAWMALSLAAVGAAMVVLARALGGSLSVEARLAVAAFTCAFQPLVLHLERGQVDAFTLLLAALALAPVIAGGRDRLATGVLIAAAAVLKPIAAGLVPFLLLRRRFRAAGGFGLGALLALGATVALHGTSGLAAYLTRELPRISVEGEAHGETMRLDPDVRARLRGRAAPGTVLRDGRAYRIESFRFVTNASLVRPLKRRLGLRLAPTRLALLLLGALLLAFAAWSFRAPGPPPPAAELAYWQAALAALLLAWPVTWAMNAVWLLPAALLAASAWPEARGAARAGLAVAALGLLLAGVPDPAARAVLGGAANLRYVAAEALVLASLLAASRALAPAPTAPASRAPS